VCPVQATYHRDDGLVVMDYDRCIGCRYCEVACPYDARKFNLASAPTSILTSLPGASPKWNAVPAVSVEKCTFCIHRIDDGLANA